MTNISKKLNKMQIIHHQPSTTCVLIITVIMLLNGQIIHSDH